MHVYYNSYKKARTMSLTFKDIPWRVVMHKIFPYHIFDKFTDCPKSGYGKDFILDNYGYFQKDVCRKIFRIFLVIEYKRIQKCWDYRGRRALHHMRYRYIFHEYIKTLYHTGKNEYIETLYHTGKNEFLEYY